jgi:hypothetical protein
VSTFKLGTLVEKKSATKKPEPKLVDS